jgi:FtsP/CotA-like multicopper oxidase with cupredoxin domain
MWTFDGTFPGPTIRVASSVAGGHGDGPVRVRFTNDLPAAAGAITVHNHGGHSTQSNDGQPDSYLIPTGGARTYTYGLTEDGRPERAAFQWYHDHRMNETARNVWMGLAGMFIIDDEQEQALHLPSARYDVPLMIVDRDFTAGNQLADHYPAGGPAGAAPPPTDAVAGDHVLVNGAYRPHLDVGARRYRLRLLDAANSSLYDLFVAAPDEADPTAAGTPVAAKMIATESGLVRASHTVSDVSLAPAERQEIVVDFGDAWQQALRLCLTGDPYHPADRTYDECAARPLALGLWRKGDGGAADEMIMQFRIHPDINGDGIYDGDQDRSVPSALRPAPALTAPAHPNHTWTFGRGTGPGGAPAWAINGKLFDPNRVDAKIPLGVTQRWRFIGAGGATHVVHLHDTNFFILSRNGHPPTGADAAGLKESFVLHSGDTVDIALRFTDNTGRFMLHCHILEHEDNGMMTQFRVYKPQ